MIVTARTRANAPRQQEYEGHAANRGNMGQCVHHPPSMPIVRYRESTRLLSGHWAVTQPQGVLLTNRQPGKGLPEAGFGKGTCMTATLPQGRGTEQPFPGVFRVNSADLSALQFPRMSLDQANRTEEPPSGGTLAESTLRTCNNGWGQKAVLTQGFDFRREVDGGCRAAGVLGVCLAHFLQVVLNAIVGLLQPDTEIRQRVAALAAVHRLDAGAACREKLAAIRVEFTAQGYKAPERPVALSWGAALLGICPGGAPMQQGARCDRLRLSP